MKQTLDSKTTASMMARIEQLENENLTLKIGYAKYIDGYRPGEEHWSHYDQEAMGMALAEIPASNLHENTENEPFLIRLLEEKNELQHRIASLNRFNHSHEFLELSEAEQALLLEQHRAMQKYYGILNNRCEMYA
jgi:hypothetical protein